MHVRVYVNARDQLPPCNPCRNAQDLSKKIASCNLGTREDDRRVSGSSSGALHEDRHV